MEKIRLLHFADLHIGMENYGRLDPRTGVSGRVLDFLQRFDNLVDYGLERDVDLLKWDMVDELNTFDYFSAEKVFGYFVKLMITERWFRLIPKQGAEMFDALVTKLKESFTIDENAFT